MIERLLGVRLGKLMLLEKVWLFAPFAVWFSYQPLVRLGQDATSYYELSITVIYVALLALVSLPYAWRARRELVRHKAIWLTGAFADLSLLTLLWTPNLLRGFLTVGIVYALFFIFAAALAERERLKKLLPALAKLLVVSAVFISLLAFAQVVAGIWLSRSETLLCAGCIADQFGFVRPNVFAIEPQFLGSLLLAPLLLLLRYILKKNASTIVIGSFFIISVALFLTLSRGAIFAFLLGVLVLFVLYRHHLTRLVAAVGLLSTALVITLCIQGTAAMVNPRVDVTFREAVAASINQLSLGVVDIAPEEPAKPSGNDNAPKYDGYVEESTNVRLGLSQLAFNTWTDNPLRILFGVGIGGAGVAMHEQYPDETDARQIVQNQYVEVLLEYGLVGMLLFVSILVGFLKGTRNEKWIWAFLIAYIVQWNFFSGYPNALHIYLVLIAVYVASSLSSEHRVLEGRI